MGKVEIRYYVTRRAWKGSRATWGYWVPSQKMQSAGFSIVACGEDGPAAWDLAEKWNARWDAHRASESAGTSSPAPRVYPFGSLGEAFDRFKATKTWEQKKPRTRETGIAAGNTSSRRLAMSFQNCHARARRHLVRDPAGEDRRARGAPRDETLARAVEDRRRNEGPRPRRRPFAAILWRKTPAPRNAICSKGKRCRPVKRAWRMGYRGLAAALAVAWDTMLSPVDVRALTRAQLRGDAQQPPLFAVARAKTGKAAIGTLSRRTKRLLDTYSATLPPNLLPSAPIFYTRGGEPGSKGGRPWPPVPYTADTLGDDFRAVRGKEFPGDKRQLMDFRRSGAVGGHAAHSLARWPTPSTRTVAGDLSASTMQRSCGSPTERARGGAAGCALRTKAGQKVESLGGASQIAKSGGF